MATSAPKDRYILHNPLRVWVETAPGSGEFLVDPRLRCASLLLACDGVVSRAEIDCFGGPIDLASMSPEPALTPGGVLNSGPRSGYSVFLSPDQEIMVTRDLESGVEDNESMQILFSGYCDRPAFRSLGSAEGSDRGYTFLVESLWKRLADSAWAQILGRRMRSAQAQAALEQAIEEGANPFDAHGGPADAVLVRGRPCTFNARGRGNRAKAPIEVAIGDRTIEVHVFTDDADPDAERWTWAQVLRYLVFWHQFEFQSGDDWDDLGMIADGNAFDATDQTVDGTAMYRATIDDRPSAPVEASDAFAFAMLGEPADFQCDGLSFPEAAALLAEATGCHCRVVTDQRTEEETDEDGNTVTRNTGLPVNRLHWWARGSGEAKDLSIEATFADRGLPAEELFQKLNVRDLLLEVDYSDVIPNPIIVGDVRRYEITCELVPGWEPDANLDDVPDLDHALDYAREHLSWLDDHDELSADPWYQRYHPAGELFHDYAQVGRRWVLNETGRYKPEDYARTTGPFGAEQYKPWEPSKPYGARDPQGDATLNDPITDRVLNDAGEAEERPVEAGSWARVGRPFRPCFAADAELRSLGIVVEISCDGGANWFRLEGGCRSLAEEAGIYIDEPDLTTLYATGPGEVNGDDIHFWEAMVRNSARVRVTAVIEGDQRLEPNLNASPFGPPKATAASRLFDVSQRYKSNRREGGNSIFRNGSTRQVLNTTLDGRDDLLAIQEFGIGLMEVLTTRQQAAKAVIPWLETQQYAVGDCLREIRGTGMVLRTHAAPRQRRHVDIVGIQFTDRDTTLILDDFRLLDTVGPSGFGGPA